MLTREQILGADDLVRKRVEVPEWGDYIYVRMLTGRERELMEQWYASLNDQTRNIKHPTFRAGIVVFTVCDDHGHNLFTLSDIEAMAEKSFAALHRVCEVAMKLNRLGDEAEDELVGNSSASLDGVSGSV